MKKRSDLMWDNHILHMYNFDFDNIRMYFDKLISAVDQENFQVTSSAVHLKNNGVPDEEIADILDDDDYNAKVFENNTYNIAIIFLYSECEKTLKYQYRVIGDKKTKKMFKWDNILLLFKEKGIDIKTNSHYAKLNEIREINNCIKHNGYPSDVLCNMDNSRWQRSEQIAIQKNELISYYDEARAFFDELVNEIDSVNKKALLAEEITEVINLCNANLSSVDSDKQELIRKAIAKFADL